MKDYGIVKKAARYAGGFSTAIRRRVEGKQRIMDAFLSLQSTAARFKPEQTGGILKQLKEMGGVLSAGLTPVGAKVKQELNNVVEFVGSRAGNKRGGPTSAFTP